MLSRSMPLRCHLFCCPLSRSSHACAGQLHPASPLPRRVRPVWRCTAMGTSAVHHRDRPIHHHASGEPVAGRAVHPASASRCRGLLQAPDSLVVRIRSGLCNSPYAARRRLEALYCSLQYRWFQTVHARYALADDAERSPCRGLPQTVPTPRPRRPAVDTLGGAMHCARTSLWRVPCRKHDRQHACPHVQLRAGRSVGIIHRL